MTANFFLFCLATVLGFLTTAGFALLKYSSKGAAEAFDMLVGQACTYGGLLLGVLVAAGMFAFVAGKLTS